MAFVSKQAILKRPAAKEGCTQAILTRPAAQASAHPPWRRSALLQVSSGSPREPQNATLVSVASMSTTSFFARGTLRTPDVLTALLHAVTAETTTLQPSNSTVGCTPSGADEIQKPMLNVALTLKRSTFVLVTAAGIYGAMHDGKRSGSCSLQSQPLRAH